LVIGFVEDDVSALLEKRKCQHLKLKIMP
jgi:hypothetical protein